MSVQKKPKSANSNLPTPGEVETDGTGKSSAKRSKRVSPEGDGRKKASAAGSPNGMEWEIEQRIAVRAYSFYEERNRLGAPLQDWLRAEREVLAMMGKEN